LALRRLLPFGPTGTGPSAESAGEGRSRRIDAEPPAPPSSVSPRLCVAGAAGSYAVCLAGRCAARSRRQGLATRPTPVHTPAGRSSRRATRGRDALGTADSARSAPASTRVGGGTRQKPGGAARESSGTPAQLMLRRGVSLKERRPHPSRHSRSPSLHRRRRASSPPPGAAEARRRRASSGAKSKRPLCMEATSSPRADTRRQRSRSTARWKRSELVAVPQARPGLGLSERLPQQGQVTARGRTRRPTHEHGGRKPSTLWSPRSTATLGKAIHCADSDRRTLSRRCSGSSSKKAKMAVTLMRKPACGHDGGCKPAPKRGASNPIVADRRPRRADERPQKHGRA